MTTRVRSVRELEDENSRLRWQMEEMEAQYQEERRQHQEEIRRHREESKRAWGEEQCHADTWEEAFAKWLPKILTEVRLEARLNSQIRNNPEFEDRTESTFWSDWLKEVTRAKEIYDTLIGEYHEEVAKVRRAFCSVWASHLHAEFGETETVVNICKDNPEYLTKW